ncbi:hypothetical protein LXL04_039143 [Taraxacum kok-saghyz]
MSHLYLYFGGGENDIACEVETETWNAMFKWIELEPGNMETVKGLFLWTDNLNMSLKKREVIDAIACIGITTETEGRWWTNWKATVHRRWGCKCGVEGVSLGTVNSRQRRQREGVSDGGTPSRRTGWSAGGTSKTYLSRTSEKRDDRRMEKLEGIRRRFLWGGDEDKRKIHWVAWEKVVTPKKKGGLGVGSIKAINIGLLVKWWWRLKTQPHSLWRKFIFGVHNLGKKPPDYLARKNMTGVWKNIAEMEKILMQIGVGFHDLFDNSSGTLHCRIGGQDDYRVAAIRSLFDLSPSPTSGPLIKWYKEIPSKVACFVWRASMCRIPTADALSFFFSAQKILDSNLRIDQDKAADGSETQKIVSADADQRAVTETFRSCANISAGMRRGKGLAPRQELPKRGSPKQGSSPKLEASEAGSESEAGVTEAAWSPRRRKNNTSEGITCRDTRRFLIGHHKAGFDFQCSPLIFQHTLPRLCGDIEESADHILVNCRLAKDIWSWLWRWVGVQDCNAASIGDILEFLNTMGGSSRKKLTLTVICYGAFWRLWLARNERSFQKRFSSASSIMDDIIALIGTIISFECMMKNPECGYSGMESVFSGFVLDPEKCNQLSLEEKRKLVHRIAHWSEDAPKILSSLTRKELLEIICAEMGKERKYSGFTKLRMIQHLLKLVSKHPTTKNPSSLDFSPSKKQKPFEGPLGTMDLSESRKEQRVCQNLACKAMMSPEDAFCKRCSCCICYKFDDNKDPSLWLTCDWDSGDDPRPCGMSCHLQCAVGHDKAGIRISGNYKKLDGGFYCVSCGKLNGLMRSWRKQLVFANDARRVDALCLRVSLSHKILEGTLKHQKLLKIVESAALILENEVGSIGLASVKMDRRLVNRLSCSSQVQKLCTSAIEAFDLSCSNSTLNGFQPNTIPNCRISFEESTPTSTTIVLDYEPTSFQGFFGCRIWHRKSTLKAYPKEATYIVLNPEKRFKIANLDPSTEYLCMVSFFSNTKVLGFWESNWTTNTAANTQTDSTTDFPCTPCKSDGTKKGKKNEYEYAVGVVKGLEDDGFLCKDFRVKFLTWFSLKASMQQRRVVNVFVDALIDDPPSLAEQLLDTFSDEIRGR